MPRSIPLWYHGPWPQSSEFTSIVSDSKCAIRLKHFGPNGSVRRNEFQRFSVDGRTFLNYILCCYCYRRRMVHRSRARARADENTPRARDPTVFFPFSRHTLSRIRNRFVGKCTNPPPLPLPLHTGGKKNLGHRVSSITPVRIEQ